MSRTRSTNLSASVRERLLDISKEKGEDFNLTLTQHAVERLLYRLNRSVYCDRFVIKGAVLFAVWLKRLHRPTRDLDLLGYGSSSAAILHNQFQDICRLDVVSDGLFFDPAAVCADRPPPV